MGKSKKKQLQNIGHMSERCKLLPKIMRPNQKAYEALNFMFEDIHDNVLVQALLPEGWSMEKQDKYTSYFVDENGNKRGISFYDPSFGKRNGYMELFSEE